MSEPMSGQASTQPAQQGTKLTKGTKPTSESEPNQIRDYKLDFDGNYIITIVSIDGSTDQHYKIGQHKKDLLANDGIYVGDEEDDVANFKTGQARINELDGYKDGSPGLGLKQIQSIIRGLDIYEIDNGDLSLDYPSGLKKIQKTILHAKKDELQHLSWIKLKKKSELDDKFTFEKVLWECGLKQDVFIENILGEPPLGVRTFGGEIDALSKSNTQETFPKLNESVTITENFMNLMGFRPGTSINNAKLVQETKTTKINAKKTVKIPDVYTYTINLGVVGTPSPITIENKDVTDDKNRDVYFRGNAVKREVLLSCKNNNEKKKFILAKELGDKLQVIIYYIILNVEDTLEGGGSHILTTCDMVVFTLCLILGIRCMYTGAYKEPDDPVPPNEIDPLIKKYSVLYYEPSNLDKHEKIIKIINDRREKIYKENLDFSISISSLKGSQIYIYISGSYYRFRDEFYQGIEEDIAVINCKLLNYMQDFLKLPTDPTDIEAKKKAIEALDPSAVIKEMEHLFLVIHFIRKNKNNGKLEMIQANNYTRGYKNKDRLIDNIKVTGQNPPLCKAFYLLATKYCVESVTTTPQTGGGLYAQGIEPGDDGIPPGVDPFDSPGIFTEDDIDPTYFDFGDENIIDLNLALTKAFNKAFYRNIERIIDDYDLTLSVVIYDPYVYNPYLSSLHYTLYTLFLYDRYIERSPSLVVEYCDIKKLLDTQTCFPSNSYTKDELNNDVLCPPPEGGMWEEAVRKAQREVVPSAQAAAGRKAMKAVVSAASAMKARRKVVPSAAAVAAVEAKEIEEEAARAWMEVAKAEEKVAKAKKSAAEELNSEESARAWREVAMAVTEMVTAMAEAEMVTAMAEEGAAAIKEVNMDCKERVIAELAKAKMVMAAEEGATAAVMAVGAAATMAAATMTETKRKAIEKNVVEMRASGIDSAAEAARKIATVEATAVAREGAETPANNPAMGPEIEEAVREAETPSEEHQRMLREDEEAWAWAGEEEEVAMREAAMKERTARTARTAEEAMAEEGAAARKVRTMRDGATWEAMGKDAASALSLEGGKSKNTKVHRKTLKKKR